MKLKSFFCTAATALLLSTLAAGISAQGFVANHLFVASSGTDSIFEFDENANFVQQFGPAFGLTAPQGLTFGPNGDLYATTGAGGGSVFQITIGNSGPPALVKAWGAGLLTNPKDVAFGADGSLYVGTDTGIVEVSTSDTVVRTISNAAVLTPSRFCYGNDNHIYAANNQVNPGVAHFNVSGALVGPFGATPFLNSIAGITSAITGNLIVADTGVPQTVATLDSTGTAVNTFTPASAINSLTFGPNNKLFATNAANQVVTLSNNGVATVVVPASANMNGPTAIAFAPFRFSGKITGTLARPGLANKNPNQSVNVSIGAGSGVVMIQINDNPNNSSDLTDVFGASAMVFHGFESDSSANNKIDVHGAQECTNSLLGGVGSIALDVTGKTVALNYYKVTKGTGTIHRASPAGVLNGKITTSKWINN